MVFLSASKIMVGDNKTTRQGSIEIRGPLASTKEHQQLPNCLAFTAEKGEDFADGWLPTLNFKIRVNSKNIIEYCCYEKPTTPNRCLRADTALSRNCLVRSLSNEVMRRLDSFSEGISMEEKTRRRQVWKEDD